MKFYLVILIDYLVHMNKCCESKSIHFYVNHAGIDKLVFNPFKADSCWSGTKSSIVKSYNILFCFFVYLYDFFIALSG